MAHPVPPGNPLQQAPRFLTSRFYVMVSLACLLAKRLEALAEKFGDLFRPVRSIGIGDWLSSFQGSQ